MCFCVFLCVSEIVCMYVCACVSFYICVNVLKYLCFCVFEPICVCLFCASLSVTLSLCDILCFSFFCDYVYVLCVNVCVCV